MPELEEIIIINPSNNIGHRALVDENDVVFTAEGCNIDQIDNRVIIQKSDVGQPETPVPTPCKRCM